MLGEEQRVDQQPQLGIGKIADKIEIRPDIALFQLSAYSVGNHADGFAVFDFIAAFHQADDVAAYGFALHVHVILRAQNIHDVLLTEPVLSIGVTAEDIQNVDNEHFLRLGCHANHLGSIIQGMGKEYNPAWDKNIPQCTRSMRRFCLMLCFIVGIRRRLAGGFNPCPLSQRSKEYGLLFSQKET